MHAGWCALCRHRCVSSNRFPYTRLPKKTCFGQASQDRCCSLRSLDALSKGRAGASLWPGSQPPDPVVHLRRAPLRCDASSSASASGDVNDRQPRSFARLKAVQSQTDVQAAPRQTLPRRRRNSRGVPAPPIDEDEDSGNGEEDVEVLNLQTGWSAEALKEGLGAWSVTQTRAEGSSSSTAAATVGDLDGALWTAAEACFALARSSPLIKLLSVAQPARGLSCSSAETGLCNKNRISTGWYLYTRCHYSSLLPYHQ